MKKITFIFLLLLSTFILKGQVSLIPGKWLLVKEQTGNRTNQPYYSVKFYSNQLLEVMEIPIGKWDYVKDSNMIRVQSNYQFSLVGNSKVKNIDEHEMVLAKGGTTSFYLKLDQNEINNNNSKASFVGVWQIENGAKGKVKLLFGSPEKLTVITNKNGSEKKEDCHWIYNSTDNTVIIYGLSHLMRGKHQITQPSANKLVLTNNGKTITAVRKQ